MALGNNSMSNLLASRRPFVAWSLGLALIVGLSGESRGAAPTKRARPPKFSKSITDVFFLDAREKLVGPRPDKVVDGAPVAGAAEPSARPPEGGKGPPWSTLIAAEVVEDEIKAQQMQLGEAVQNATKFKGGQYQRARRHLSMLATLFAIDAQYDQKMRWQREAPGMRDLLGRAGFNCKVATDASYHEARTRWEDLQNVVRGNPPSMPTAAPDPNWAQVADRAPLMKRLEQAQQQGLTPWTANAGEFKRHAEKLSHEAQLVAALAEVIGRDGYESSDDETYRQYAHEMQTQAQAVRDAVEQKNYEQARQAVIGINKACVNCHEGFRD
jgi:hypothetical protein